MTILFQNIISWKHQLTQNDLQNWVISQRRPQPIYKQHYRYSSIALPGWGRKRAAHYSWKIATGWQAQGTDSGELTSHTVVACKNLRSPAVLLAGGLALTRSLGTEFCWISSVLPIRWWGHYFPQIFSHFLLSNINSISAEEHNDNVL